MKNSSKTDGCVTFVIPNYNHAPFLTESLQAIFNQTRPADKIIIIDDASTDESVEIIQKLVANQNNVLFIPHKENKGCVARLTEGLQLANTEYIAFFAADDRLALNYLETYLALIQKHPQAAFCSGACYIMDNQSTVTDTRPLFEPSPISQFIAPQRTKKLLRTTDNFLWGNTVLYRRAALLSIGGYKPELDSMSDSMAMRELGARDGFCYIAEPLAYWRFNGNNMSVASSINHAKLENLIAQVKIHLAGLPPHLFPKQYFNLIERRLRFGSARLLIGMAPSLTENQLIQLHQTLNHPFRSHPIFKKISQLPLPYAKKGLLLYAFLITRPFGIFALMKSFLKSRFFNKKKVAIANRIAS